VPASIESEDLAPDPIKDQPGRVDRLRRRQRNRAVHRRPEPASKAAWVPVGRMGCPRRDEKNWASESQRPCRIRPGSRKDGFGMGRPLAKAFHPSI